MKSAFFLFIRCKLRWVLRRALNISHDTMGKDEQLLVELTNYVAESLNSMYPEVGKNLAQVNPNTSVCNFHSFRFCHHIMDFV